MARKRRQTGWQPPPAPDWERDQLAPDLLLLPGSGGNEAPGEGVPVQFVETILYSDNLIDEPEFEGIYAEPFVCMQVFSAGLEARDLEGVDPDQLRTAEKEEVYLGLLEEVSRETLVPELQEAILAALRDLRQRAQDESKVALMSQAAAVYAFLDGVRDDEVWAQVGVVQAVVQRSLRAGIEIYNATEEAVESAEAGGIRRLLGRLTGARPEQNVGHVVAKYPGLADFLAGEVEGRWHQGVDALGSGELDLGLFSEAELAAALEAAHSMGLKLTAEGSLLVVDADSAGEELQAFASWLSAYVDDLAAPRRLAHMQSRLDELAETASPSQLAFLSLLSEELEAADGLDRLRPVLERALVGEMRNVVLASEQGEG